MLTRRLSWLAILLAVASPIGAQPGPFPPQKAQHLEVLPKDIPIRALIDTMAGFTRALGVRCTYCHVGQEGQPLNTYDFISDQKPEKQKARAMLRMVSAINGEHLAKLASRTTPAVTVSCATCHRGVAVPRPLDQTIIAAYDAGGPDSAEATYRALRQRYYGRASYDFGEVALADVGAALRARGKLADAVRFYMLNAQMLPTSSFAFRQAAGAQAAAGDTAGAIASLEKALAINANDGQAKQMMSQLRKP